MPNLQRETQLRALGYRRIVGVDEAGRGPLAGPVVAGAVVLPPDFDETEYSLLNDSKQLNARHREELYVRIVAEFSYGIGIVEVGIIDEINIRQASWLAMKNAVADLAKKGTPLPDFVLIDGLGYGPGPFPYEAIVKGDAKSFSIAAASIIAKVTRDIMMEKYDIEYSGYGFAAHKGYGTRVHLEALRELGPCPIHRKTFAPVHKFLTR